MKSILRDDFRVIGRVVKTHGNHGQLRIELDSIYPFKEWAFLEFQGKPVPFYIRSVNGHEEQPILLLEGISDQDQAKRWIGSPVLAPDKKSGKSVSGIDFTGYAIHDLHLGNIGTVEALIEMPGQLLIQTTFQGRELLIPAADEIITGINKRRKELHVHLPEGLTDI